MGLMLTRPSIRIPVGGGGRTGTEAGQKRTAMNRIRCRQREAKKLSRRPYTLISR
jgi:hypothetical protein